MSLKPMMNPAEQAAEATRLAIEKCIDANENFLVEAGAGAGKTFSLIQALNYIVAKRGRDLMRNRQRVACITYTNVAVDEIRARTDAHPAIAPSTIHSFFWSLVVDFQSFLRKNIPSLEYWPEKLAEAGVGDLGGRRVCYNDVGHRRIEEEHVFLHHDDVLVLASRLLAEAKFRFLLTSRYPVVLIDEYQDTDCGVIEALKAHVLDARDGPLVGFFGDHWQKIYGPSCGKIEHASLTRIGKRANFRSVPTIVDCLNRLRPGLPQEVSDPTAKGVVSVYHTNNWSGTRRTGQHWGGDLPPGAASAYLDKLMPNLESDGWKFSDGSTKILMLTHRVLAAQQGYSNLAAIFPFNDAFIKKEDPYIAFFADVIEPMCRAYEAKRYGQMLSIVGQRDHPIRSPAEKSAWARDMDALLRLRSTGTVGAVLDHVQRSGRPPIPDAVERRESALRTMQPDADEKTLELAALHKKLRDVSYQEVVKLCDFINESTPFSTKHGVKGAEFKNVLVVFGRGWNLYDFNQFLESTEATAKRLETYERNRNLFYVACSRPKKRLALLFTQELSVRAMSRLEEWFGRENIHGLSTL